MKKKIMAFLPLLLVLLVMATPVYAKDKTVVIDSVICYASSVSVSGSTDAVAVTIQIRNSDGTIVAMDTVGTQDGKFVKSVAGQFSVGGAYQVYVADYEGGSWAKQEATAIADPVAPSPSGGGASASDEKKDVPVAVETPKQTQKKKGVKKPSADETEEQANVAETEAAEKAPEVQTPETEKAQDTAQESATGTDQMPEKPASSMGKMVIAIIIGVVVVGALIGGVAVALKKKENLDE